MSLKMSAATVAALLALFAAVDIAHAGVGDIIETSPVRWRRTVGDVEEQADELADAADETRRRREGDGRRDDAPTQADGDGRSSTRRRRSTRRSGAGHRDGQRRRRGRRGDRRRHARWRRRGRRQTQYRSRCRRRGAGFGARRERSARCLGLGVRSRRREPARKLCACGADDEAGNGVSVPTNAAQKSVSSPVSSALLEQAATPLGAPTMQLTVSTAKRIGGGPAASSHDRLQASPWGQPPAAPMNVRGNEDSSSSQAPALPFGPRFPADLPSTAVAGAGAAGSALTVALLCALMLLAPRAGRLARAGPILAGPKPCLSLSERPG